MLKTVLPDVRVPDVDYFFDTSVAYFNGQIIAGQRNGKLAIMNEELETAEILNKPQNGFFEIDDVPRSVSANGAYLACCDDHGGVFYYTRNSDMEPMVSSISVLSRLSFILGLYS